MTADGGITAREFDAVVSALRSEMQGVARVVEAGAERGSREHAEVRGDLKTLRETVATRADLDRFKEHVYVRLDQHDEDLARRRGADRLLTRLAAIMVGSAAVGGLLLAVADWLLG